MTDTRQGRRSLEQLIYGWSPEGREGRNRYQVVASSETFTTSLATNGKLSVTARKLCYLNDRHDNDAVSTGWVRSGGGTFLFRRQASGPDSWGRTGGFSAHVLYSPGELSATECVAVLQSSLWMTVDDARSLGVDLPTLAMPNGAIGGPAPSDVDTADLIDAVLASSSDGRRIVLAMPWDEALATMGAAAAHLPVDLFAASPFSTYEVAKDEIERYAICGVPESVGVTVAGARVVGADRPSETGSIVGRITVQDSRAVVEAIHLATDRSGEFSGGAYATTLQVITGNSPALDADVVESLLGRPSAVSMAFRHADTAVQAIDVSLAAWQRVGASLCRVLIELPDDIARSVIRVLADQTISWAGTRPIPDVVATAHDVAGRRFLSIVEAFATALDRQPDAARFLPPITAGLLLTHWPNRDFSHPAFRTLCATSFDRGIVHGISGVLDTSVLAALLVYAVDRRDAPCAAHLLSQSTPNQLAAIEDVLAPRQQWRNELDWLVDSLQPRGGDPLGVALGIWCRSRRHPEFATRSRLHRAALLSVEAASDELLDVVVHARSVLPAEDRRLAVELAQRAYPALICVRISNGQHQLLRHGDIAVIRALAADSARLAYLFDQSAAGQVLARSVNGNDLAQTWREVDRRIVDGPSRDQWAIAGVLLQPLLPKVSTLQDARRLIDHAVGWHNGDQLAAVTFVLGLSHGAMLDGRSIRNAQAAAAMCAGIDDAVRRGPLRRPLQLSATSERHLHALRLLGAASKASSAAKKKPTR